MTSYVSTDQRLHWLCQVLAKVNRTWVPSREDDSHTNLYFDSLGDRIIGRWIQTNEDKLMVTLNLTNLNFEVVNDSQQLLATFPTTGHSQPEIEQAMAMGLTDQGLDTTGFIDPLHFGIPEYDFAQEPVAALNEQGLHEWKYYRHLANDACDWLLGHAQSPGEVRIWPHHFDTGIYTVVNARIGIGFGLAMQDTMVGAPYFYMSGYPIEQPINYDNIRDGDTWRWKIGEHWKGAVLPLTNLGANQDEHRVTLEKYMVEVFHWFLVQ